MLRQALTGGGGGAEGGASIEQQANVLVEVLLEMSRTRLLILLIEDGAWAKIRIDR